MSEMENACTISGLRPHKFPPHTDMDKLYAQLEKEIRKSIFDGFSVFQTGMAMGIDIISAERIIALRREFPHIQLHSYLPCETQANNWPEEWRDRYFTLLEHSDKVVTVQTHYSRGCMLARNRAMIDNAKRLLAVYDECTPGGTAYTISYAIRKRKQIVTINPLMYQIERGAPDESKNL